MKERSGPHLSLSRGFRVGSMLCLDLLSRHNHVWNRDLATCPIEPTSRDSCSNLVAYFRPIHPGFQAEKSRLQRQNHRFRSFPSPAASSFTSTRLGDDGPQEIRLCRCPKFGAGEVESDRQRWIIERSWLTYGYTRKPEFGNHILLNDREGAGQSSIETAYSPIALVECPTCLILTKRASNCERLSPQLSPKFPERIAVRGDVVPRAP